MMQHAATLWYSIAGLACSLVFIGFVTKIGVLYNDDFNATIIKKRTADAGQ